MRVNRSAFCLAKKTARRPRSDGLWAALQPQGLAWWGGPQAFVPFQGATSPVAWCSKTTLPAWSSQAVHTVWRRYPATPSGVEYLNVLTNSVSRDCFALCGRFLACA
jgi:hypothetical protein